MPLTELFLVVAFVIGAGVIALIAWVTSRRHSIGHRYELQMKTLRNHRPHPVRPQPSTKP